MFLTKDTGPEEYTTYDNPGMSGVLRRQLINPDNSSTNFVLRAYILEPGGHTSYDVHPHEHGVYMLRGNAVVIVEEQEFSLQPGDVLHISGNEAHQFFNRGSEPVKFLCVRNFISS